MHRESVTTVVTPVVKTPHPLRQGFNLMCLLGYFTLLPIFINIGVQWAVYFVTAHTWFPAGWMMPTLLLISTFLGGVFIRQKLEEGAGGLGLFVLGILGLCLFAYLTDLDIHRLGGVYSRFLPVHLRLGLVPFVYLLPGVGLFGMLFYKFFSLKN